MRLNSGSLQYVPVSIGDINNIQSNGYLENTSYMFTKHIRGTAAYWKSVLFKLLAMIKTFGIPDYFLTLSCNDDWPELQEMLQKDVPGSAVSNNPLMAALTFHNVLKGKPAPLGRIKDFFVRVEFQARGSPHLHIFLWTSLHIDIQRSMPDEVIHLINSTIQTILPDEALDSELHNLVKKFQIHHHTFTCNKGRANYCRFEFSFAPCNKKKIVA